MNAEIFRFTLGDFKCMAVSDGTMTYTPPLFPPPASFLCVNAPRERLEKTLAEIGIEAGNWVEWKSTYNCLLIETASNRILVDTGADGIGPDTGRLLFNLQQESVNPEDIDLVILTHGHPDHLGGNTDKEGNPVFPKARWVMWKEEWEFWTSDQPEKQLAEHGRDILIGSARKNLLPLRGRLDLIDQEAEIISGIRAIPAPGHTPGQMALKISSRGESLVYISDIVLHPLHLIEPQWCAAVDILPEKAVATRLKVLPELAAEKTLVMAFHFPFPGLGHIMLKEEKWGWEPL